MNAKTAKKIRQATRRQVERKFGKTEQVIRSSWRLRVLFELLKLAQRIGFPVKNETLVRLAQRGTWLELRAVG